MLKGSAQASVDSVLGAEAPTPKPLPDGVRVVVVGRGCSRKEQEAAAAKHYGRLDGPYVTGTKGEAR